MSRSPDVTVCVRPSALLTPALFLLLTDTPVLLAALLPAALLHELAHYAVLRLCGVRTARFTLTGLGASLYVPELHRLSYGAELLSAAAGPLMNLLLWVLLSLTGREELTLFAGAQMVLGVLNLLPVRPMDGGRILWLATAYLTELTPIARLSTAVCGYADVLVPREGEEVYLRVLPEGGMTSLLVYAIVGLALLALGWLLYRRRPSEAAGDAIAFRWLRPIVRWTVGLCGGLGLGLFLSVALLGGLVGGLVQLLLCQTVMGLLCFFAAQMLLQKSFRVFRRSWKEALALVIALAAITLCIRQDFFDVQNRIPGASQVDTVSVQLYAGDISYCETDDPAVLERVQALHRAALAQGEDMADNSDRHMSIRLRYELKNGDTVRRDYTIACVSGTETYRLTNQLLNMPQFRRSAMGIDWLETSGLDAVRSGYVEDYWTGATVDLTREQATELCRLAQQDANDVSDSDVLAAMAANSDDAYAAAAKEDTLPAETEAWDVYRYNIVIYAMVDGRDVSRSLTPMGYCTRMQSFIGSLDFANTTTVDTEAVS